MQDAPAFNADEGWDGRAGMPKRVWPAKSPLCLLTRKSGPLHVVMPWQHGTSGREVAKIVTLTVQDTFCHSKLAWPHTKRHSLFQSRAKTLKMG
jgi:hypothetical protein